MDAAGYLIKQTSPEVVGRAIREVRKGQPFFSSFIARRVPGLSIESPDEYPAIEKHVGLSSREMEALKLIAEGKANKHVAAELAIGIKTVKKHRQHLMSKLDRHDTAGLTCYAIAAGIIERRVQVTII